MQYERKAMHHTFRTLSLTATLSVAMVVVYSLAARAQSTAAKPGEPMAVLLATPMDIAEGKRLAELDCAICHSATGISGNPDIPHIAGQRPIYLYLALKAYQSGARGDTPMNDPVKFLSEDALIKVAAYYASLDPAPLPSAPSGPAKPDTVQAGKGIAAACVGCHGNSGVSQIPGNPSLAGLDPKVLVDAMQAYKNGQRKDTTMRAMVASLSDTAMNDVALYFALQPPARAKTPAAGDAAAGKAAAGSCTGCHGEDGVSTSPTTPSLAGQDAQYLVAALQAYKGGARANDTMKGLAASISDAAMKNVAAYFATQEPKAPNVRKPLTTQEWTERCNRCHGVNGNSADPRIPMLASQQADYLRKALQEYQAQTRKSHEMGAMAGTLSEADIENLAAFYAHQKARAVLFVPLPAQSK